MLHKVGIICPSDRETVPFLEHIQDYVITEKAMLKIYNGSIHGVPCAVVTCGVCKVNAAIAAQILIDHYGVNLVINSGTAGGIAPELHLFDAVIATESVYHDVASNILTECHPWMDSEYFHSNEKLIELSELAVSKMKNTPKVYWGRMVTGEAFIEDDGRQDIIDRFAPLSVDMETASIAHVCYVNQIPFIAVRSITDTATHMGAGHFHENCPKASTIAKDITLAMLEELNTIVL